VLLHLSEVPVEQLRLVKRLCIYARVPSCDEQYSHWGRVFKLLQAQPGSSACVIRIFFRSIWAKANGNLGSIDRLFIARHCELVREFGLSVSRFLYTDQGLSMANTPELIGLVGKDVCG
jgi:hypothetical protein